MASGPVHYAAAERLLDAAEDGTAIGCDRLLAAARVHASLALTAAVALPLLIAPDREIAEGPIVPSPVDEWEQAIL